MSSRRRFDIYGIALSLFYILAAAYILAPLVIVVITSFNSGALGSFPPQGFSLRWYQRLMNRPEFLDSFIRTLIVGVLASLVAVTAGLLAGIALVRYRFRAAELVQSFFLSPIVVPKIVLGLAFFILFLRLNIFGNLYSLILAHVVILMPFALAVLVATLASLDPSLEEAAQDLGARDWQVIWHIILPQTRLGLAIAGIFAFIISFDQIDTTLFLVRPNINTLPIEMFLYQERDQDLTLTAVSTALIGFAIVLLLIAKPLASGIADVWSRRQVSP